MALIGAEAHEEPAAVSRWAAGGEIFVLADAVHKERRELNTAHSTTDPAGSTFCLCDGAPTPRG